MNEKLCFILKKKMYYTLQWKCNVSFNEGLNMKCHFFYRELENFVLLIEKLDLIHLQRGNNCIIWKRETSRNFSSKSDFLSFVENSPWRLFDINRRKAIRKRKIPKKVIFFLWPLMYRSLQMYRLSFKFFVNFHHQFLMKEKPFFLS